ncbi:MAG: zf-HC2 domain-containing protein, partial [Alphaproteobacteria bacterium]|nr:zf-HC2 domain-containing protein [Alphaproteobacteria bacterium]
MKACRQTGRLIELQFEGELSWKQELRLQDHLADCPECAALSRAQGQVLESLGSYREAPLAKIDVQRFVEKVQDSISDKPVGEAPPEALQPTRSFNPFALAAAVLLALGLPWVLNRTDKPSEGEPDSTTERLAEITPELQPDPVGEPVQAPRPIDHDSDFQAERHQAAVADLRGALSALMGESPDWKLYGDRVEALRTAGWPMASLISGLLGDEHLETAKAAIQALAREGGRLAHRRLWDLRRDERLGSFAVEELQVRGVLTMAQVVDLYWEGQFEVVALDGLAECNGAQALQGAKRLMRKAPRRKIPDDSIPVLAGLLQRAGDAGSMHALALLEDRNLSQELWAAEVARSMDLREVLEMYLACGDGSAWENGALALASQHTSAVWVPFLEECCNRSRTANRAVRALQGQPGLTALELLLTQESNRMVNEDVWLAAWNKA